MTSILKASSSRTYLRALRETRVFWPHLALILVMGLLGAPLGLLAPVPMKVIVDSVVGGAPAPAWLDPALFGLEARMLFPLAVGLTVALAFVGLGHRLVEWLFREWVAERIVHAFRTKLFAKLLDVSAQGRDAAATQ